MKMHVALLTLLVAPCAWAQAVSVELTEWKVGLSRDTVRAGTVNFRITNRGTMTHGFFVRGDGVEKSAAEIGPNAATSLSVTLKPGTYEVYCPLSDLSHRMAGMTRKVVAVADAPKKP